MKSAIAIIINAKSAPFAASVEAEIEAFKALPKADQDRICNALMHAVDAREFSLPDLQIAQRFLRARISDLIILTGKGA